MLRPASKYDSQKEYKRKTSKNQNGNSQITLNIVNVKMFLTDKTCTIVIGRQMMPHRWVPTSLRNKNTHKTEKETLSQ